MDQTDGAPTPPAQPLHACARRIATRRAVFGGAAGLAAVPLLAACGGSDSSEGSGSGGSSSSSGGSDGGSASAQGIPTSDIPVGGGTVYQDQELVVTQPTEGDFRAFSAVCTHQQCLVSEVGDDGIDCTCHGSVFSIEDGSPQSGPADEPLPSRTVTVSGDTLTVT